MQVHRPLMADSAPRSRFDANQNSVPDSFYARGCVWNILPHSGGSRNGLPKAALKVRCAVAWAR